MFPKGKNCFEDDLRITKIDRLQQMRAQLRNIDRRFATNPQYLAFCVGLIEQKQIRASIGVQARIKKDKLTGKLVFYI